MQSVPSRGARTASPFVAWLEATLRARGLLGPAEAGRAIGIPQSMMSNYLNGRYAPSRRTVRKLAEWSGTSEAEIWAMIPDHPAEAGAVDPVAPERAPAWAQRMQADIDALKSQGTLLPAVRFARPAHRVTAEAGHRPRLLVELAPRKFLTVVETDDLVGHDPPIPFNAALWLDADRAPAPGDAVYAELAGTVYARLVAPDGVTLVSPVPDAPDLRLDAVDRVYGVGYHLQVTW